MYRSIVGCLILILTASAIVAGSIKTGMADQRDLGRALTAFHEGQTDEALTLFTKLVDENTSDPRVYYFRGLIYLRSGRPEQAEADFKTGAKLESDELLRFYPINKSLQFVQGSDRVEIEKYRAQAVEQKREMRRRLLETRYDSGDAPPLPDPSSLPLPDIADATDDTLPTLQLAPLNPEQIRETELVNLPVMNGSAVVLAAKSNDIKVESQVEEIIAGTSDTGSRPITSSTSAGSSDPFATGSGSGGDTTGSATDPFSGGSTGSTTDPFETGAGKSDGDDTKSGDSGSKTEDPFATGGGK